MIELIAVLLINLAVDLNDSLNDRMVYIKADKVKVVLIATGPKETACDRHI